MKSMPEVLIDITEKIESDLKCHWDNVAIEMNKHEIYYRVEYDRELLSKLSCTYDNLDTIILEDGTIDIELTLDNDYDYTVYICMP